MMTPTTFGPKGVRSRATHANESPVIIAGSFEPREESGRTVSRAGRLPRPGGEVAGRRRRLPGI